MRKGRCRTSAEGLRTFNLREAMRLFHNLYLAPGHSRVGPAMASPRLTFTLSSRERWSRIVAAVLETPLPGARVRALLEKLVEPLWGKFITASAR